VGGTAVAGSVDRRLEAAAPLTMLPARPLSYSRTLWGQTKNDRLAKQLCTATLDYANYASVDTKAVEVTLDLQPLNKRITRGSLHLTIQCEPVASDAYALQRSA